MKSFVPSLERERRARQTSVPASGEEAVFKKKKKKESAFNAGDRGNVSLIPGLGRFPGGINSNAVQYSCLKNIWMLLNVFN